MDEYNRVIDFKVEWMVRKYMMGFEELEMEDQKLYRCLEAEEHRQQDSLEMIASESIQPKMALNLAGSIFNNKTATGSVGKQRLLGAENVDALERLAAERACRIFGAEYANMLTYSGTVANFCAYEAVLNPNDPVLALSHSVGAHQSHGGMGNVSSRFYQFQYFGVDPQTMDIDYDEAEQKAQEYKPKLMVVGSAAYPRNFDFERLAGIAHRNGALLMVDVAHFTGLIAAGVTPNPFPHADIVTASTTKTMCGPHSGFIMCKGKYKEQIEKSVYPGHVASPHLQTIAAMAYVLKRSQTDQFRELMRQVVRNAQYLCEMLNQKGFRIFTGGTDCHMFLLDVKPFRLDGVCFAESLNRAGITVNSKSIPYEVSEQPGGIRLGTTVLTQRGMKEHEMEEIAELFYLMGKEQCSDAVIERVKERALALAKAFPIPQ